jgi:PilZ domain
MRPERRARRYRFDATAEAVGSSDVRPARVETLSILGAYLAMPHPFEQGASVLIKIRTKTEFFQSDASVAYSNAGQGMGVEFIKVSRPFLLVLQEWLFDAVPQI